MILHQEPLTTTREGHKITRSRSPVTAATGRKTQMWRGKVAFVSVSVGQQVFPALNTRASAQTPAGPTGNWAFRIKVAEEIEVGRRCHGDRSTKYEL